MSLARAARRTVRRGLNAFRTTVLFWSRPSLVLLDMIEAALLWAGCPDDRAIDVTQACALGFASTWFLVVGWALWRHPVATPSAATAIGTVTIRLDGGIVGLIWAAARCIGALAVVVLLVVHWMASSALSLALLWPMLCCTWLVLCCACSFLDLGMPAAEDDG